LLLWRRWRRRSGRSNDLLLFFFLPFASRLTISFLRPLFHHLVVVGQVDARAHELDQTLEQQVGEQRVFVDEFCLHVPRREGAAAQHHQHLQSPVVHKVVVELNKLQEQHTRVHLAHFHEAFVSVHTGDDAEQRLQHDGDGVGLIGSRSRREHGRIDLAQHSGETALDLGHI